MIDRELLQRYLDGDPDARGQVDADPALLREALAHARLEEALRALHEGELARERRLCAVMADVRGEEPEHAVRRVRRDVRARRRRGWLLALAAGLAAAVGLEGGRREAAERLPVHTGDTLVLRAGETGRYRMEDGSTLNLSGPADLIIGRTLRLQEGRLSVVAAKRPPSDPLVVLAPHARAEVLGTKFAVDAASLATRLHVREGRVRFIPNGAAGRLVGRGATAEARLAARDPVHQPFASDSPWNTALGAAARLEPVPALRLGAGVHIETREWAIPIYVAAPADPVRRLVYRSLGTEAGRVRIDPATPAFHGDADTYLALVDERLDTVWELSGPARDPGGDYRAGDIGRSDLRGSGWGTEGPGHSGASLLGGLVRRGELARGIPHALAALVRAGAVNRTGQPFEWPATHALSKWDRYGDEGNLRLGSLLALPPETELAGLQGPALRIAEALRDYGAYVVGSFDGGQRDLVLVADRACDPEMSPGASSALAPFIARLQRVANNAPESPGGGGAPRRPPPPPLVRLD